MNKTISILWIVLTILPLAYGIYFLYFLSSIFPVENGSPKEHVLQFKIIKAIGFYNFPGFKQYGCDGYMMELGEDLGGIIPFCGKILHNCWHGLNRMELDKTAIETYFDKHIHDGDGYSHWIKIRQSMKDKILAAMEKDAMHCHTLVLPILLFSGCRHQLC